MSASELPMVWGLLGPQAAFFSAAVAGHKNRSMFWWALGGVFFPGVLLLILAFLPKLPETVAAPTRTSTPRVMQPAFEGSRAAGGFATVGTACASN